MRSQHGFVFPPFHLDLVNRQLWRDSQLIPLRPKTFAVLQYLVEHAGELVSREELLTAVWPNAYGAEDLPKRSIHELRKVFSDETGTPRVIETLSRRGWRFIGDVVSSPQAGGRSKEETRRWRLETSPSSSQASSLQSPVSSLVGRDAELAQLHYWLAKAEQGERQIVFVTGEPGIGKTALIGAFLQRLQGPRHWELGASPLPSPSLDPKAQSLAPPVLVGRGQCLKQHGTHEAYLPVFEALTQLTKGDGGEHVRAVLRQYAPTWVVQMPGVLPASEMDALLPRVAGATRERMLRELAEALEVLTRNHTVVLWFDDLHDSDPSTLDLIAYLARRHQPARLLLIGTYRPAEALVPEHGLTRMQQELRERRSWQELALECLDESAVTHYLALHFAGLNGSLSTLAHAIHRRTEGHPLFLVSMVEDWQTQQLLLQKDAHWELQVTLPEAVARIPATLHSTLLGQLHALSPEEQMLLEAASVAGLHFTVPVVSVATGKSLLEAEEICENLARRERFIVRDGVEEWPDATLATRYRFRHALHHEVAYQRIPPLKRAQWHQQIGERREAAFAAEPGTVAVELAMHFAQSRDYARAVRYFQLASSQAVQRSAYSEAIHLATKGLTLLRWLPDSPYRAQLEMAFHLILTVSFMVTQGCGAPAVGQAAHRALELSRQADDDLQLFPVLGGLFGFYLVNAEYQTAREVAERLLRLAEQQSEPILKLAAHLTLAVVLWQMGEFTAARSHFDQRHKLYRPQDHLKFLQFGHCPTVTSLSHATPTLWYLGYPEQARRAAQEAVALAEQLAHPYTHVVTLDFMSSVFQDRHEIAVLQTLVEARLALSREHEFPEGVARGTITQGWIQAQHGRAAEAISVMKEGITANEVTGNQIDRLRHISMLAEAYALNDQPEEGLEVLAEALQHVEKTGERYYEAEVYRLRGEILLTQESKNQEIVVSSQHSVVSSPPPPTQSSVLSPQSSPLPDPQPLAPSPQAEAEAEACFLKAITIAQQQQAKSLELRAVMSLVRLRQRQCIDHEPRTMHHESRNRLSEAHQMLSDVYHWFTEGFDTADLQAAKALLEELRHGAIGRSSH